MNNTTKTKEENNESNNEQGILDYLIEGNDFVATVYKTMAACISSTLIHISGDIETAAVVKDELNEIRTRIPISGFFVQSNLKDVVVGEILANGTRHLYFTTLNQIFIPAILSKTGLDYPQFVDRFLAGILPTLPDKLEHSILPDNLFLQAKCDVGIVKELLSRDPLLLTIYTFRISLPFSEVFKFGN